MKQQIIAMGGGGFSMEPDNLALDRYVLEQAGRSRPQVCFLPPASGDADGAVARFGEFLDQYPHGARAADAMFRCWEILDRAGRGAEARAWLERLVAEHPKSDAAGRARALLGPAEGRP